MHRGIHAARRELRLLSQVAQYELRKATAFRTGFIVRELLRGVNRPAVMIFVYLAMLHGSGRDTVGGFTFPAIVHYLILVATFQKMIFHERALELSDQIFDGYITKYLVMPFHYFSMVLGRWIQYTLVQIGVALLFWIAGALLIPAHWPFPASPAAALQALCLVVLGSYCYMLLYFILHSLAFYLDVVWTLLIGSHFVSSFVAGTIVPVAMMPAGVQTAFHWLFPYWTLSAPIEIFMGRLGGAEFQRGLLVLAGTIVGLESIRSVVWSRGIRRYTGSGM